jgi:hypothetical protein
MRIEYIRIQNYKCFADTGNVPLASHVTVVVGQNNAGKTAFLDALRPTSSLNKPHLERAPTGSFPPPPNPHSEFEFGIGLSGDELKWLLLSAKTAVFFQVRESYAPDGRPNLDSIFSADRLPFVCTFKSPAAAWNFTNETVGVGPAAFGVNVCASLDRKEVLISNPGNSSRLGTLLVEHFLRSIYVFRAERLNVDIAPTGHTEDLSTDAANLASVLLQLAGNPSAQSLLTEHVRAIFPSIFDIKSRVLSKATGHKYL